MLRSDESNIAFAHAILNVKYQQSLEDSIIQRIIQCRSAEELSRTKNNNLMPLTNSSAQVSSVPKKAPGVSIEKQVVDHSYTDFSQTSDDALYELMRKDVCLAEEQAASGTPKAKNCRSRVNAIGWKMLEDKPGMNVKEKLNVLYSNFRRNSGGVVQPFPEKLMELLANPNTQHIVSWMPHGRAFKVHSQKQFIEEVLPNFAGSKNIKYMSFNRQLNLWGFKRLTKGLDNGAYYHELFLRGRPMLAMRMKRHKVKGTGVKLGSNPEMEPNFYTMDLPKLPELSDLDETGSVPVPDSSVAQGVETEDQKEEDEEDDSQESDESSDVQEPTEVKKHEQDDNMGYAQSTTKAQNEVEEAALKMHALKSQSEQYPSPTLLSDNELERRFLGSSLYSAQARLDEKTAGDLRMQIQGRALSEEARPRSEDYASRGSNGSRASDNQRELAHNEMLLEKQRQELSLLNALANLKRQEYEIMSKMCQLGENALSRGLIYRANMMENAEQSRSSTVEAALLHDQLASVRAMQRSEAGRVAPDFMHRGLAPDSALSGFDGRLPATSYSSAVSALSHSSDAMQRAVLNSRQELRRTADAPASPALVHAATRLSTMRRGGEEEGFDHGHLQFPFNK